MAYDFDGIAVRVAAAVQEGDVCRVDMAVVQGVWPQQLGIIKDVVRQGGGKVVVEEVRGDTAQVSAHDNPVSRLVGMVDVPLAALKRVASSVTAAALRPGDVCVVDLRRALDVLENHPLGGGHLVGQVKDTVRAGKGRVVVIDTHDLEHGRGPGERMVFVAPEGHSGEINAEPGMVDVPVSALRKVASSARTALDRKHKDEIAATTDELAGRLLKDAEEEAEELARDYGERRVGQVDMDPRDERDATNEYWAQVLLKLANLLRKESSRRIASARTAARWYVRMKSGNWGYQDAPTKKEAMEQAEEDWGKKEGKPDYAERVEGKELKSAEVFPEGEGPRVADGAPYAGFVGDPGTHGIEEPRGGGFSIMQDLQRDLVREQGSTTGTPVTAGLRSRRGMYWCAPERTYRLTKGEQDGGAAVCPKCRCEMEKEPFTKSEKIWVCPECRFKVPTGKTTTTRVTIDVDKDTGEVDVDVTNASRRGGKGALAREMVAGDEWVDEGTKEFAKQLAAVMKRDRTVSGVRVSGNRIDFVHSPGLFVSAPLTMTLKEFGYGGKSESVSGDLSSPDSSAFRLPGGYSRKRDPEELWGMAKENIRDVLQRAGLG